MRREIDVELGEREGEHGDVEGERNGESGDAGRDRIGVVARPSHNIEPRSHVDGEVNVVSEEDVTLHLTAQVSTSAVTRIMETACCLQ